MGELKDLREQQENLLDRAKETNRKLYLAALGAISKATETADDLMEKYVSEGREAFGETAEEKPRLVLASRGMLKATRDLVENAPEKRHELYERFVDAGRKERGEKAESTLEFVLAGIGAVITAREESQKLFDELVEAGEKRA